MAEYKKAGEIEIEVTETTQSIITLCISQSDLDAHDCAHLYEFRDKIRLGKLDPFMFNPLWSEPVYSSLESCKYWDAEAILPNTTNLED
jgi:hypothetical protein